MATKFGCDLGQSSLKIVGAAGALQFASQAALFGGEVMEVTPGRKRRKPVVVETQDGKLYVGHGAHSYGMPVENMDFTRLSESAEIRAVWYGAMSEYMRQFGALNEPLKLVVGLPFQMLIGQKETVTKFRNAVNKWMGGEHHWTADGKPYSLTVEMVHLYPQALGAPVDYALDMNGQAISEERTKALANECGTISIGSNTVELLVSKRDENTHRFNGGKDIGVRQLWRRVDPRQMYTFGEFCDRLEGDDLPDELNVERHLDSWAGEILGYVNSMWGQAYNRFHKVFLVGGGAILLENRLRRQFNGKSVFMDDPVMSIGRGMYKVGFGLK